MRDERLEMKDVLYGVLSLIPDPSSLIISG